VIHALALAALLHQAPAPAHAPRTIRVPRELPTVQQAIDSARAGDTVLVAPGRYVENLRLRGTNIVLAGEFILARDTSLIARTILDGSRPAHPDSGSVLTIYQFEDSTTVVEGFTITGGSGTVWYDNKDKILFREGGGILIDLAGPTIRDNVITGNRADTAREGVLSAGGGGIRVGFADPVIEHNVVSRNHGRYGGGIVLFYAAATLRGNVIEENTGGEDFGGAGLWAWGQLTRRLPNVIEGNVIRNNRAAGPDGRSRLRRTPQAGKGGGLSLRDAGAVLRNNVVTGNVPNDVEEIP
jgi:Right handed beta helix region